MSTFRGTGRASNSARGRVQRIGEVCDVIHVMNLPYAGTVEDDIYIVLSERFSDIFSVSCITGVWPVSVSSTWGADAHGGGLDLDSAAHWTGHQRLDLSESRGWRQKRDGCPPKIPAFFAERVDGVDAKIRQFGDGRVVRGPTHGRPLRRRVAVSGVPHACRRPISNLTASQCSGVRSGSTTL